MPLSPELDRLVKALSGARVLPAIQGVRLGKGVDAMEDAGLLEDNLRRLEDAAGLAPRPSAVTSDWTQDLYAMRVRAVRTRLTYLGFSAGDLDNERVDVPLLKALTLFQKEAGLDVTAGIDPATWAALQELVALEPPFHVDRWVSADDQLKPALVRAMQLRLTVLGMRENKPVTGKEGEDTRIPLNRFRGVISMLGLESTSTLRMRDVIALLFDHDRQLEAVARGGPGVRQALTAQGLELGEPRELNAPPRYLLRLARAELWLNGYPVGEIREPVKRGDMQKALRLHWANAPTPLTGPALEARVSRLGLETFEELARQQHEPEVPPEQLAAFVKANEPVLEESWARHLPNSRFSIWDGFQRALRWLGRQVVRLAEGLVNLVRRDLEYAVTLVRNVFRMLFKSVNDVLTDIRRVAAAFVDGVRIYVKGELHEGSPKVHAVCRFHLDGDIELTVVEGDAGIQAARVLQRRLKRVGASLSVAASALSIVVGLVAAAARGVIGWLMLIAQLVRVGPELWARVQQLAALAPAV